jgi:protein SCO1
MHIDLLGNARRLAVAVTLVLLASACGVREPGEKLMEIPEFELIDHRGTTFRSASLQGEPALLFFGFTHCPDACPMMLSLVARAYREAGPDARRIPTIFVSVDPRDTPPVLAKYLSYFSAIPSKGLTGSKEQIDTVVKHFGAKYEIRDTGSAAGATVDHSLYLYLLDREGDVVALFSPSTSASELAKAMKAL